MSENIYEQQKVSKWWVLLSGALFTILGIYFYNQPVEAIVSLVYYIAFAKILSGIAGLSVSFKHEAETRRWNLGISIIDLIFGVVLLSSPFLKITLVAFLPYLLAAWSFSRGILVIISAFKNKEQYKHWWLTALTGALSVIAGIFILAFPMLSILGFMQVTGIFMIIMGVSLLIQFVMLLFSKNK